MNNKWTKENFEIYDKEHPDIWEMFKKFSLQVAQKRPYFSAKCVFHRVRWETAIGSSGDFKINDGWISHYARKFVKEFPNYHSLFEFRTRKESYHNKESFMDDIEQGELI
jgi:hypothetical protein